MLVCLLFGYSSSMTLVLSTFGLPTQIMNMLPYVMVLIVLLSVGIKNFKGKADIS
jgi:simple sugar transport system permease protein